MAKRKTIKYGVNPRASWRYRMQIGTSTDPVVWHNKRGNGAFIVIERGKFVAYTGYGMNDDGPFATLQAARTAAGRYLPSSRWSM